MNRHASATTFLDNLGQSIRENPVPVLVTGIGLSWLVAAEVKRRRAERRHELAAVGSLDPARPQARLGMTATHLGTQQGRASWSQHRPDVVGEATHLGTGQGWRGYVYPGL